MNIKKEKSQPRSVDRSHMEDSLKALHTRLKIQSSKMENDLQEMKKLQAQLEGLIYG